MIQPVLTEHTQYLPDGTMMEDDPPMLRFDRCTLENRMKTEETGRYAHKDAIRVFVRSFGDNKTEVPYIVWTTVMVPHTETILVKKPVPIVVREADGSEHTEYREQEAPEEKITYIEEDIYPWLDQLDERLRNNFISQNYRDSCRKAFDTWKEHGDVPIDGVPVADWKMISPAQQENLIAIGINSVELVAGMSEDVMERYGMGGHELKKKAAEWLGANDDAGVAAGKIVALETRLESQANESQGLKEKLAELQAKIDAQNEPKRGPGRPKKDS
tara:strand:- start:4546 stop:5364 length:819 start_codon:yes stop_codon:yes gene_type:complete